MPKLFDLHLVISQSSFHIKNLKMKIFPLKNYLFVLIVCSCLSANGQIRRFEFSFGVGNNGQIQEVIDEYFYISGPYYVFDEVQVSEASNFKYSLAGKVFINDHLSLRLKYGYSKMKKSYEYTSGFLSGDFWNKQTVTNFNPALSFNKKFVKINISTGVELAFYKVNDNILYFEGKDHIVVEDLNNQNTYIVQRTIQSETTMKGGKGTAINCFLELDYSFLKRMGVGISMSYGYLWSEFGDEIIQKDEFSYSGNFNLPSSSGDVKYKKYKNKSFAPPEISIFLFLRLGKILGTPKTI